MSWALVSFSAVTEADSCLAGTPELAKSHPGLVARQVDEQQALLSKGAMSNVMTSHIQSRMARMRVRGETVLVPDGEKKQAKIKAGERCCKLETLQLRGNAIGDRGVAEISRAFLVRLAPCCLLLAAGVLLLAACFLPRAPCSASTIAILDFTLSYLLAGPRGARGSAFTSSGGQWDHESGRERPRDGPEAGPDSHSAQHVRQQRSA